MCVHVCVCVRVCVCVSVCVCVCVCRAMLKIRRYFLHPISVIYKKCQVFIKVHGCTSAALAFTTDVILFRWPATETHYHGRLLIFLDLRRFSWIYKEFHEFKQIFFDPYKVSSTREWACECVNPKDRSTNRLGPKNRSMHRSGLGNRSKYRSVPKIDPRTDVVLKVDSRIDRIQKIDPRIHRSNK